MDFHHLLERANMDSLESFLLYSVESLESQPFKSYSQHLSEAHEKLSAFLKQRFPTIEERDQITECLCVETDAVQDVYFEIGLLTGAKIAFQVSKRLRELE